MLSGGRSWRLSWVPCIDFKDNIAQVSALPDSERVEYLLGCGLDCALAVEAVELYACVHSYAACCRQHVVFASVRMSARMCIHKRVQLQTDPPSYT